MVFSTPRKRATKRFYIEPHLGSVLNAVCCFTYLYSYRIHSDNDLNKKRIEGHHTIVRSAGDEIRQRCMGVDNKLDMS